MTSEFHGHEPIVCLFVCFEVSSLIRGNVAQKVVKMDKAFYESSNGSGSRSIIGREGKSISKICVYPNKKGLCPFV